MAAEPWIDHGDPAYWQELIKKDLALAKAVLNAKQYYTSGLQCHHAAEKILCCWFVERHSVNDLPMIVDLVSFAEQIGATSDLSPDMIQLLGSLDRFGVASTDVTAKEILNAELTKEDSEILLASVEELHGLVK